jgi:hypothetical protein
MGPFPIFVWALFGALSRALLMLDETMAVQ